MTKSQKQQIEKIIQKLQNDVAVLTHHFDFLTYAPTLTRQIDSYAVRRPTNRNAIHAHLSIYFDILADHTENLDHSFAFSAIANHCEMRTNNIEINL